MRLTLKRSGTLLVLLWLTSMSLTVLAQDSPPVATPFIPIVTEQAPPDSAAPTLEPDANVTPIVPEPPTEVEATPEEDAAAADETTAPGELPPGSFIPPDVAIGCPIQVQEGFTATELVCGELLPGQVCLGNGAVVAQPRTAAEGFAFAQPGDRTDFSGLNLLTLQTSGTPNNIWAVVSARPQFNTQTAGTTAAASVIFFGDVAVADTGETFDPNFQSGTIVAQQGLNVRRTPDETGVVVWQLQPREEVIVTGRSTNDRWIRIEIPSAFGGAGWVYAPYIEVPGGRDALPIVDVNTPRPTLTAPDFGPMQAFTLRSSQADPTCPDALDSGLLMQSPSGLPDALRVRINDVEVRLNGTLYARAQANGLMNIIVLEGEATAIAAGGEATAQAGQEIGLPLTNDLTPGGVPNVGATQEDNLGLLPIRLLPRAFNLTGIDLIPVEPTPTPADTTAPEAPPATSVCIITAVGETRNIRSGPGTDFEIVSNLEVGRSTIAVGQARDDFNFVWLQLDGGWIRADTVDQSGPCADLPVVDDAATDAAPPSDAGAGTGSPLATVTPTPTPDAPDQSADQPADASVDPTGPSLRSEEVGEVCGTTGTTLSTTSDGSGLSVSVGGEWTATEGTRVTIIANGGQLRPELGDYIRVIDSIGNIQVRSGNSQTLIYTFAVDSEFTLEFSAAAGDTITASIFCN